MVAIQIADDEERLCRRPGESAPRVTVDEMRETGTIEGCSRSRDSPSPRSSWPSCTLQRYVRSWLKQSQYRLPSSTSKSRQPYG